VTDETDAPSLALSLERLQRLVEVGFERTNGQTSLILLRLNQGDGRHADLVSKVETLEARVGELDKDAVTNEQLKERTRFILTIVTALVMVITGVFGAIQFFNSP
jgi:hypothetical protein